MYYFFYRLLRKANLIFYKAFNYKMLKGVVLFGAPRVFYPSRVVIGKGTRVNERVFIHGEGSVIIGENVTLSYGATILSTGYDTDNWMDNKYKKEHVSKGVIISDNVWIGANVTILDGVRVAEGVIVAAGAVVVSDLESKNSIYGGVPAKKIKNL